MRNECGKSRLTLVILTILIIIGATVLINYAKEMVEETKVQDLRTNMLLIQAEAKNSLDEVGFQTVNLAEDKAEDLAKINEAKQKNLKGVLLTSAPEEVQEAIKNIPDVTFNENSYYLDDATLAEMGIKDIDSNKEGYFIVNYDLSTLSVEVINTKGYNGSYTLTQLIKTTVGDES